MSELVILIHGTWANSTRDEGEAWWQRGSSSWQAIRKGLPDDVALVEEGALFHWTGANNEWAREQASELLLRRLAEHEATGRPYHLIGHSHGGSVIWSALKSSVRKEKPLIWLKSWTTVGTPFLHFRPSTSGILQAVIGYLLLGAWLFGILAVSALLTNPVYEYVREHSFVLRMLALLWFFLCAVAFGTIGAPIALLGRMFLVIRSHVARAANENDLAQRAMDAYRSRWMALWSSEDEALAGLAQTVGFKATLLPELFFPAQLPFEHFDDPTQIDREALLLHLWNRALTRFNNTVLAWANKGFSGQLARTLQGNNRPGMVLQSVAVSPLVDDPHFWPPLPECIDRALIRAANDAARNSIPSIRTALGQALLGGEGTSSLGLVQNALSMKELVHTSYFDNDDVVALLCLHIGQCCNNRSDEWGVRDTVIDWYRRSRNCVLNGKS